MHGLAGFRAKGIRTASGIPLRNPDSGGEGTRRPTPASHKQKASFRLTTPNTDWGGRGRTTADVWCNLEMTGGGARPPSRLFP